MRGEGLGIYKAMSLHACTCPIMSNRSTWLTKTCRDTPPHGGSQDKQNRGQRECEVSLVKCTSGFLTNHVELPKGISCMIKRS